MNTSSWEESGRLPDGSRRNAAAAFDDKVGLVISGGMRIGKKTVRHISKFKH